MLVAQVTDRHHSDSDAPDVLVVALDPPDIAPYDLMLLLGEYPEADVEALVFLEEEATLERIHSEIEAEVRTENPASHVYAYDDVVELAAHHWKDCDCEQDRPKDCGCERDWQHRYQVITEAISTR